MNMDFNDLKKELQDIKDNPETLSEIDSNLMAILKEIIKIERKHLYGLDSSSSSRRKEAIQDLISEKLKTN
jgi:hypothetical protein